MWDVAALVAVEKEADTVTFDSVCKFILMVMSVDHATLWVLVIYCLFITFMHLYCY